MSFQIDLGVDLSDFVDTYALSGIYEKMKRVRCPSRRIRVIFS